MLGALHEKEKRHKIYAENTLKSGYGKTSTLVKSEEHTEKARRFGELANYIASEWD